MLKFFRRSKQFFFSLFSFLQVRIQYFPFIVLCVCSSFLWRKKKCIKKSNSFLCFFFRVGFHTQTQKREGKKNQLRFVFRKHCCRLCNQTEFCAPLLSGEKFVVDSRGRRGRGTQDEIFVCPLC